MRRALAASFVLLACTASPGASDEATTAVDGTSDDTGAETSTGDAGEPLPPLPDESPCSFAGHAPGLLPPIESSAALDGSAAIDLAAMPGATHSWLLRDDATLARIDHATDTVTTVLDLSDRADRVVALALPPDHAESGHLFVRYEAATGSPRTVVLRVTATDDAIDPASARVVIELPEVVGAGSGGALAFDDDGRLFIGVGDLAADPIASAARDRSSRLGKLLRIDPTSLDDTGTYAIPPDNPFVGSGLEVDEAIWASGLRDPWRCTVVPGDPAPWCVDVGVVRQETDHVEAGADLGWPLLDGGVCLLPGGDCSNVGAHPPTSSYPVQDGDCGLAGLVVVAGTATPELAGALLSADRCSGRVRGLDLVHQGTLVHDDVLGVVEPSVSSIAADANGRVHVLGPAGALALAVEPSDEVFPATLSQSGCFTELATLAPAPGVVPYELNAPLWTDGAIKQRFIVLPADARIGIADDGALSWPTGTALIKNFSFPAAEDPGRARTVETRVMVLRPFGWQFHGYRWNADGTDAELLLAGVHDTIAVGEGDGVAELEYAWPSRDDCRTCHGMGSAQALGPRLDQLDREVDYGHVVADQLDALAGIGMFTDALPQARAPITAYENAEAPLEHRARAYLHANCGHCHRPGGWTPPELTMDLRWGIPFADTATCDVALQYFNGWVPGETRIVPGAPEDSVIWQRMELRGPGQMPPLATVRADPAADVVRAWIAALDGCP